MFSKIGTGELLLILGVALVIFGPNKLPNLARSAGKLLGTMKGYLQGFKAEMDEAAKEIADIKDEVAQTVDDIKSPTKSNLNPSTDSSPEAEPVQEHAS